MTNVRNVNIGKAGEHSVAVDYEAWLTTLGKNGQAHSPNP